MEVVPATNGGLESKERALEMSKTAEIVTSRRDGAEWHPYSLRLGRAGNTLM